jgi:hypothetical protein
MAGRLHLAAVLPFHALIPCAWAALWCGVARATIHGSCGGVYLAPLHQSQQHASVVHHGLAHPRLQPALGLLIHPFPRREVVRHPPPRRPRPGELAEGIGDVAQLVGTWLHSSASKRARHRPIHRH